MDGGPGKDHVHLPAMTSPPGRAFDQPERDWLHQLRRRRAVWISISGFVLVVTVLGLVNLFSRRQPDPDPPAQQPTFVLHGRSAGGAGAQLLVSALGPAQDAMIFDPLQGVGDLFADNFLDVGSLAAGGEAGPHDAPFLRRKTLTSADVVSIASRYFLDDDVIRALRLAWCLSGFDPQAIDPISGRVGLFQHDPSFWPDHAQLAGFRGYDVFDPEANTAVAAYLVYEGAGWQAWDCPT